MILWLLAVLSTYCDATAAVQLLEPVAACTTVSLLLQRGWCSCLWNSLTADPAVNLLLQNTQGSRRIQNNLTQNKLWKTKTDSFLSQHFLTRSKNVGTYDGIHTSICFIYTVSLLYLTTITLAIQLLPDAVLPVEAVHRLSLNIAIQFLPGEVLDVTAVDPSWVSVLLFSSYLVKSLM